MPGKQLSRWTACWFAGALVFLVATLAALTAGVAGPGDWSSGRALAVVHLGTLGWLVQAMLGALIQFAPVLAARALVLPRLALPALILTATGTLALALGFLGLEGWATGLELLGIAPALLGAGLLAAGGMVVGTLVAAGGWRDGAGRMVLLAFGGLAGLWLTGLGMALALAGLGEGAMLPGGLPLHILLGAGGWLSVAAFGVSYKLFAMFLLAPEEGGALRRATFAGAVLTLALQIAGIALTLRGIDMPLILPLTAGGSAVLPYVADIRGLWQARRRPVPEVNMQMTRPALVFLGLALALAFPAAMRGGVWAEAAVFAALAGWLSTLTLAQMVKIVSFLTWIQIFAPRIGRAPVPMVHDLTDARAATRWLWVWVTGASTGTAALLAANGFAFRLAAAMMLAAALGLIAEMVAIRRLTHLPAARRPARLPPVIFPLSTRIPSHAFDPRT